MLPLIALGGILAAIAAMGAGNRPPTPVARIREGNARPDDLLEVAQEAENRGMVEEATSIRNQASEATLEVAQEAENRGMVEEAATLRERAETIAPTPASAPIPEPSPASPSPALPSLPEGYDLDLARRLAQPLSNHLRDKINAGNRYGYDRAKVAAFQRAAGIQIDGLYGPQTRGALQYFGVGNAPAAVFRKAGEPAVIAYNP